MRTNAVLQGNRPRHGPRTRLIDLTVHLDPPFVQPSKVPPRADPPRAKHSMNIR